MRPRCFLLALVFVLSLVLMGCDILGTAIEPDTTKTPDSTPRTSNYIPSPNSNPSISPPKTGPLPNTAQSAQPQEGYYVFSPCDGKYNKCLKSINDEARCFNEAKSCSQQEASRVLLYYRGLNNICPSGTRRNSCSSDKEVSYSIIDPSNANAPCRIKEFQFGTQQGLAIDFNCVKRSLENLLKEVKAACLNCYDDAIDKVQKSMVSGLNPVAACAMSSFAGGCIEDLNRQRLDVDTKMVNAFPALIKIYPPGVTIPKEEPPTPEPGKPSEEGHACTEISGQVWSPAEKGCVCPTEAPFISLAGHQCASSQVFLDEARSEFECEMVSNNLPPNIMAECIKRTTACKSSEIAGQVWSPAEKGCVCPPEKPFVSLAGGHQCTSPELFLEAAGSVDECQIVINNLPPSTMAECIRRTAMTSAECQIIPPGYEQEKISCLQRTQNK